MLLSLPPLCLSLVASNLVQRDLAALGCTHPALMQMAAEWWTEADVVERDTLDQEYLDMRMNKYAGEEVTHPRPGGVEWCKSPRSFAAWVWRLAPRLKRLKLTYADVKMWEEEMPVLPFPDDLESLSVDVRCEEYAEIDYLPSIHPRTLIWVLQFQGLTTLETYFPANSLPPALTNQDDMDFILRALPRLTTLSMAIESKSYYNEGEVFMRHLTKYPCGSFSYDHETRAIMTLSHQNLTSVTLMFMGLVDLTGMPNLRRLRLDGNGAGSTLVYVKCPMATHTLELNYYADVAVHSPGLKHVHMTGVEFKPRRGFYMNFQPPPVFTQDTGDSVTHIVLKSVHEYDFDDALSDLSWLSAFPHIICNTS